MTNATETPHVNRWLVAISGTVLQLVLGTIYSWSYFQNPLMKYAGWNNQQVAWILSLAICFLGLAAAAGGMLLPKYGPRKLAVIGAILYGIGWLISGYALTTRNLPLLYLGLGVIGGIGLGLGYVTPVATAVKWFPDKKGFITGMVLMGFGFGALLMSKVIGPIMLDVFSTTENAVKTVAWPTVFYYMALVLGIPGVIAAAFLQNPPAGYAPPGWHGSAGAAADTVHDQSITAKECILSSRFALMWFIFFCNITAGIMFIGFQSPLIQVLFKASDATMDAAALAAAGGTLIAISSIFNGIGRFFWGGLSDKIGRIQVFRLLLITQVVAFLVMTQVSNPYIFGALVCYVLLCYGGGFGTAPSFVSTVFGNKVMAVVYGFMLIAWAMGGLVGPQVVAVIKDSVSNQMEAGKFVFMIGAGFLAAGFLVSFALSNKPFEKKKV